MMQSVAEFSQGVAAITKWLKSLGARPWAKSITSANQSPRQIQRQGGANST